MNTTIEMVKTQLDHDSFSTKSQLLWNDWKWQAKNTIKNVDTVEKILGITFSKEEKEKINKTIEIFPMAITPYYLSLIDSEDYINDPIFKQAFPDVRELNVADYDMEDPLGEEKDSPVPGITHRYPDRVLFHISNICAMYCRHCTRKRKVGDRDSVPSKEQLMQGIEYIKNNTVVRDVLYRVEILLCYRMNL